MTRPNGVATAYGYDAAGRLVRMDSTKGATVVADIGYTLDAAGNRVGQTGPEGAQSFTLDANNRLTAATGGGAANLAYAYDAAGNRTSVTTGSSTTWVHLRRGRPAVQGGRHGGVAWTPTGT